MSQNPGKILNVSKIDNLYMADSSSGPVHQIGGQSAQSHGQSHLTHNVTNQSVADEPIVQGDNVIKPPNPVIPDDNKQIEGLINDPQIPVVNEAELNELLAELETDNEADEFKPLPITSGVNLGQQAEVVKENDNNLIENKSNGDEPQNSVVNALVTTIGDNELKVESGRDSPVNGLIYNEDDGDDAAAASLQNKEEIVVNKIVSPDYAEATVPMDDPSLLEADDDEVSVESQDLVKLEFGMKLENETFNESVKENNVDNSENDGNLVENANGNGNDKIAGNVSSNDQIGISGNGLNVVNVNPNANVSTGGFLGALGEGPWGSNSIGGQAIVSDSGCVAVAGANGNNALSGSVGFAPWANDNEFKNFINNNNNNNNNNSYENDAPTPSFPTNPKFSLFEETPNGSQVRPVNENGDFNELFFKNMHISDAQKREIHVDVSPQTKLEMKLNTNKTALDDDGNIKVKRQAQGQRTLSGCLEEFDDAFLDKLKKDAKKEDEDDEDNNNNKDNAAV